MQLWVVSGELAFMISARQDGQSSRLNPLVMLVGLLAALLATGCATHELVLSRTLRPALTGRYLETQPSLFRARVNMDALEVWVRYRYEDSAYRQDFDLELHTAAGLCAALATSNLTFRDAWSRLELWLVSEYGSQWRWRNTNAQMRIRVRRQDLLALRGTPQPQVACMRLWKIEGVKHGPPDHVYFSLLPEGS
ncbi:MAG: hypothetical protein H6993_18680 [Pseudomonadales bacterium]|nr:hypothetical protein [Pseudomonadales bacterium]MCP5185999.1 hypothetical protein [Pseudomonadales bacterium]